MSAPVDAALSKGSHSKSKRSFISRLPSFRKKKTPPVPESELDMHLRSAEEDLRGGVKIRPLTQVKNRKDDDVKRRSKTSSIVASYEKRLSDLKDEECRTNGKKNKGGNSASLGNNGSKSVQQDGTPMTSKPSRFGFGFTWQKITSFENGSTSGKKTDSGSARSKGDELNANIQHGYTGSSIGIQSLALHLPHDSPPDRESTSSVRTPESDRSSVSSNSSAKVYGQPMPYRSVFSDEPRGIKRQASSSQSEGLNSSGISMSRSASPLHDGTTGGVHHDSLEKQSQLNSTFTKDNKALIPDSDIINRTFPIEESPTCIVNRTFKLEPPEESVIQSQNSEPTVKKELANDVPELGRKENAISCPTVEASISTAVGKDWRDVSGKSRAQSWALDEVMPPEQDVSRPSATPASRIPAEISSVHSCIKNSCPDTVLSPRHRLTGTTGTMGGMQSAMDAYSTPARPVELAFQLRKPHISAIKHCSESLDSCELDSLCSEDLMCDSRYQDDDMFDTRDESSCLLSRSLSVEETAAMYRTQHGCPTTGRARSVSVDQAQSTYYSLEKRVGVTRGLSPSPLAMPLGRRGGRSYPAHPVPDEPCQSPVEELQSLIYSSSYRDADRNKNGNANCSRTRSQSGGSSHPLRPPRWPSLPPDEDGAVLLDAAVYRHMIQDMTSVKTMLLKLKRALQAVDNSSSPFEHSIGHIVHSPCSSLPTSPMSEVNPIQEVIIEDLREENAVLRKEVKNLQERLADAQHHMKELNLQTHRSKPEQHNISTQFSGKTRDQSLQVNFPTSSFPSKALPSSSPTRRKCRAEVSKIKAAYEEYIRLHSVKVGEQPETATHQGSPLKVGHSPTSSPEPPTSQLPDPMEMSPPESRRHPERSSSPPSNWSSPERGEAVRSPKSKIPISLTKECTDVNSHLPVVSQNFNYDSRALVSQASQMVPTAQSLKAVTIGAIPQKAGGPKKQTISRSKLMQPSSYKTKLTGSQDSLLSEGSQPDDGSQPSEDRRGGPLKRQLPHTQLPKSSGMPQKPPTGGKQATLELQQKRMQDINESRDVIPKPKEIRMMPARQQMGKPSSLPQRGTVGQIQKDTPLQTARRENGSLLPKIPSLLPIPKAALTAKQEPLASHRGITDRQPQLTDANSNPVHLQNGVFMKPSGLQQPQFIRKVDQSVPMADTRPKAGPIPTSQFVRRKQSPAELARAGPSQPPESESSDEEQATPPASPQSRGKQQQWGSRIAMPVRGRGASKLPRGTGIPTRRTNNT